VRGSHRQTAAIHCREVAEFIVDVAWVGKGMGDGVPIGFAPSFAETVEVGANRIVATTFLVDNLLE
jgi:acetylornithine/succinyldiaminopimelate/putrescine aminotransferase